MVTPVPDWLAKAHSVLVPGFVLALVASLASPSSGKTAAIQPALGAASMQASAMSARPYRSVAPMDVTVRTRLLPQVDRLLVQLLRDGRAMRLDGVEVFASGDRFLPGKIAVAMHYRVLALPNDHPDMPARLAEFARVAELTLADPNDTWGIYYYLTALHALHERGLLERGVSPATLARLRRRLDWRGFVRPDLTLIDLPNNYLGVAFSIARLRHLLGWEDRSAGDRLLARTLDHYRRYSGTYGFADETDGDGRFDRYSVLLIGEIAQRMVETGLKPGPEVRRWLRRSVEVLLPRLNLTGEGFEYGRSIGAYGETAFLEVLTAAARLDILTPEEERMAHAFSSRVTARYMDFWINPATGSVDLWGGGRRTDAYRSKKRIFGENLSLARQHVYTNAIWNQRGFAGRAPDPGLAAWIARRPALTSHWFARGRYDRALITVRDRQRLFGLPIVNGAEGQHANSPYFPIPHSPGLIQGAPDLSFPQLVPRITLADGSVLMPLAWFEGVRVARRGAVTEVRWRQRTFDRVGGAAPVRDARAGITTRYLFSPGRIRREDRIVLAPGVRIAKIDTQFASFWEGVGGATNGVRFARGGIASYRATGYGQCDAVANTDPKLAAPTGRFATLVNCVRPGPLANELRLGWELVTRH